MNKKEKIQEFITESYLNDYIDVDRFIRMSEKLDNLNEGLPQFLAKLGQKFASKFGPQSAEAIAAATKEAALKAANAGLKTANIVSKYGQKSAEAIAAATKEAGLKAANSGGEIISKGQGTLPGFEAAAKAKKLRFWQFSKKIAAKTEELAKATTPAEKTAIQAQIKNLQRMRIGAYAGGGATVVGTGVAAGRS